VRGRRKWYGVLINGERFALSFDGVPKMTGFFTTRFVEASSRKEAAASAIRIVQNDPKLQDIVMNDSQDLPILCAEEIEQVDVPQQATGFAFYPYDETNE